MKKTIPVLLLSFFSFCSHTVLGQQNLSKAYLTQQHRHLDLGETGGSSAQFFLQQKERLRLSPASEMRLQEEWTGQRGWQHQRYQQYHDKLPVFGARYLLHSQNNQVKYANGYLRPQIDCSTHPSLNAAQAEAIARQDMQAEIYAWEAAVPASFRQSPAPAQLTLIDPAFPEVSENLRLAYQIDLHSWKPLDKKRYLIDAHTGVILQVFPLLHEHAVPGTGATKYYGVQSFTIDSVGPQEYFLHDETRGMGISTLNFDKSLFTNDAAHWDLTNDKQDEVALDAHWCASRYYDLLQDDFDWDGLGNNGERMQSIVHIGGGVQQVNAFWDGEFAWFGDGDCKNGPLTTLEVVGHEFTHGIIDYTSQLIYSDESGAINESLADIMGKTLEYKEDPARFSWELGRTFQYDPDDPPFRSFSDPASLGHPDFYQGALWTDGAGVHTNSSVGNHWFYLMSVGESGVNEAGVAYDVAAIGVEKAAAVAFWCNRSYLSSSSGYNDFYTLSLQAAEELYGIGAPEVTTVAEAWKAVGVPAMGEVYSVDLEVGRPNSARQILTCGSDYFLPLEFNLTNMGIDTFFPQAGDEMQLLYSMDGVPVERFVPLTEPIAPGEVQDFLVDDFIYAEGDLNVYVTFFLPTSIDENFNNNTSVVNILNHKNLDNDLRLLASIDDYNCLDGSYLADFFVINNSCNPMMAGTNIQLTLQDDTGEIYWSEQIELEVDLSPNGSRTFIREMPHTWQAVNYQLNVVVAGDPNAENNVVDLELYRPLSLSIDYRNDFEEADFEEGLRVGTRAEPALSVYNGESYFTATGLFASPFFDLCPTPEDNLRGEYGSFNPISAQLIGCVDLRSFTEPLVQFDLVQFRNDMLVGGGAATSMLEFSYTDVNGTEKTYFYGQTEGLVVNHTLALPDHFFGQIKFKFADQTGVAGDEADFWEYDVQLLDNLSFDGIQVGVEEVKVPRLEIFPNPANNQLYLRHQLEISSFAIATAQGQILDITLPFHENTLDIHALSPGYYWLIVQIKNEEQQVLPFVKIKP